MTHVAQPPEAHCSECKVTVPYPRTMCHKCEAMMTGESCPACGLGLLSHTLTEDGDVDRYRCDVKLVSIVTEYDLTTQARLEGVGLRIMQMSDEEAGWWLRTKVMEALVTGQEE